MFELLERDEPLGDLTAILHDVAAGNGHVVLVSGEAGIGKTSLVERFRATHSDTARVLWGACEALFTPRPLGPLYDIAHSSRGRLQPLLDAGADRTAIFTAFLNELEDGPAPVIIVVEDVHWADEATLDLLKFLSRRIQRTAAMLIITYRDDEVGPDHPLRAVLGDLPHRITRRVQVSPLSEAAVATLARQAGRPPGDLYAVTGGNPFFVIEALAGKEERVSETVRDAVLARAARLSPPGRELLEFASVVPGRTERWLLDEALHPTLAVLDEVVHVGMVRLEADALSFRHELARLAVEASISPLLRADLHAQVLEILSRHDQVPVARLVYHADQAGDDTAVLRLAPRAAAEAARLGAHREATAHYETTLRVADGLAPAEHAELLEALGRESYLVGRNERAVTALEEALAIRRKLGDRQKQSENERWLARVAWFRGDDETVRRHCDAAIEVAEPLGPSPELARAYAMRSQVLMCAEECRPAIEWGERALDMAHEFDDWETLTHSFINVGCAMLMAGDPAGRGRLDEALSLAREHGLQDAEARTLVNFAEIAVDWRDTEDAHTAIDTAIEYCTQRDMDPYALCGRGARAMLCLWTGNWSAVEKDANVVLSHPRVPPVDRIPALVVLGLLRARRGDPGAWPLLDEAWALAAPTREQHRIAPVAAARAEAAWLDGDSTAALDELQIAFEMALARDNPWITGELAFWLWRADALEPVPDELAEPYAYQIGGAPEMAADAWASLGFPFHRALALADCSNPASAREGLRILQDLGARRVAEKIASELRARGMVRLPRGPRPTTRENPAGLTDRQLEVLALVAEGLTDSEIADRLFISPKTAGHHVSAILSKLGVRSRVEAAAHALERGLLSQDRE